MDRSTLIQDFLSELEQAEAALLTWGVVDGAFTHDEVVERARIFLEQRQDGEMRPTELIQHLQDRKLLFDLPGGASRLWRTRMAEGIRLIARLRQMFRFEEWRSGPTLVSDYRFALRPRSYPKRDVTFSAAMQAWESAGVLTAERRKGIVALLTRPGVSTLAGFQVRAAERVFRDLAIAQCRGMIVTVGTGSGKTLAFYLPAMIHIAGMIEKDLKYTKALALYPRNELLKDQFAEAYREARRLDDLLQASGKPKLTIGAFFGPTPKKAGEQEVGEKWAKGVGGYACPYIRCALPGCTGEMIWRHSDIEKGREQLVCSACDRIVKEDEVVLTRARMRRSPPDLLFTTTEMLNRSMSDDWNKHVFGISAKKPPRLVLLDEVHTYSGVHGAQVALLLRRYRHAVGRELQFTGLSATLRNAGEFFAQLTGLRSGAVQEIAPISEETQREGMEYLLALRGDPVSQASLLSTTIQTSMLVRRLLDPAPSAGQSSGEGSGLYGRRVFVFTDDLDVTNRLYHNLLDAEGLNDQGRPRNGRGTLAQFRSSGQPFQNERMRAGQSWYLCEEIGHPQGLTNPLKVGRTSSQDTGVEKDGDIIVATASLEVGFNDPEVGAVIQHKAPHDFASYLQRKGRLGRLRSMRPWTVVVLSDFGRDRLAYQGYEGLLDPLVPPRTLPVANRYVLRIQATYAFLEWMAKQLAHCEGKGNVYYDFAQPSSTTTGKSRQARAAAIIGDLLSAGGDRERALLDHLMKSLQISKNEAQAVMWEGPRALMLHVLPTLMRRLETGWQRRPLAGEGGIESYTENPLPEFLPSTLFSDLSLPEVGVTTGGRHGRNDTLPILQAMRTLAPGRVTRRFAVRTSRVSHWVAPPPYAADAKEVHMPVETTCREFEELGLFECKIGGTVKSVRCIRPWQIQPEEVPSDVKVTSNAFLEWRTQLLPAGVPLELSLPKESRWAAVIDGMFLYSHNRGAHVTSRRFATVSNATIRRRNAEDREVQFHFVSQTSGEPAAIGFETHVDGLRLLVAVPQGPVVDRTSTSTGKVRSFRSAYLRHLILNDDELGKHANKFQREWLYQIYFSALTAYALGQPTSLEIANRALFGDVLDRAAKKVLDAIFETSDVLAMEREQEEAEGTEAPEEPSEDDNARSGRLVASIRALFHEEVVGVRLRTLAEALWAPLSDEAMVWASERYLSTVGSAVLAACTELYPEAVTSDLLLDIDPGYRAPDDTPIPPGVSEIWITEATLGGGGVLEEIARRYVDDPRRFFRLLESCLGPSDHEMVDSELTRLLLSIPEDEELAATMEAVRAAEGHAALSSAVSRLEDGMAARGLAVSHAVMAALHARILRPGSSARTDHFLRSLISQWQAEEVRLGVELDSRVFAYVASASQEASTALADLEGYSTDPRAFRFHAIYGLLWPRGGVTRASGLGMYNPYASLPAPDRALVLEQLPVITPSVALGTPDWRNAVSAALRDYGAVDLVATLPQYADLRSALLQLASEPLEMGFLFLYPQIDGLYRSADGYRARLVLTEAAQ